MDNIKDDAYYLNKIISDLEFIINKTKNISLEEFDSDEMLNSAVNFKFIQISENANKLTDEIIKANPDVPWHRIKGLRNKIVHDYDNVFIDVIYQTIKEDLPLLSEQLKELLR